MARIRSVHPGLFIDDAFMELSMPARVTLFGIWVQCDDHGIFEWRPKSLKAAILPSDEGITMASLLHELEKQNFLKPFEVGGKAYGAVRNFCKWQRPKKPTYHHPVPANLRTYVDPERRTGHASYPQVENHSPTGGEIPPQRDRKIGEGGGKGKGEPQTKIESEERVPPASSETPPPSATETLSPKRQASPSRKGLAALGSPLPGDWVPDEALCERVNADFGMTEDDLQREVPAFHALNVSKDAYSQDWNATFYLFCKRWSEHKAKQPAPRLALSKEQPKQASEFTEGDWDSIVGTYARTGRWSRWAGNDPTLPGCLAPKHILEKHEINLETGERRIPPRKAGYTPEAKA